MYTCTKRAQQERQRQPYVGMSEGHFTIDHSCKLTRKPEVGVRSMATREVLILLRYWCLKIGCFIYLNTQVKLI